jgi:hypothetical protein
METEFKPIFSNSKGKRKKLLEMVRASIEGKLLANIEDMSREDKEANHYIPLQPVIPKNKKGVDKAIDNFILDFKPLEDEGEELLSFLGFFDNEPPYNEKDIYKKLHSKIQEGKTEATEIIDIVKDILKSLSNEELNNLWVFGTTVSEEEAKENIESWVDTNSNIIASLLYSYAEGLFLMTFAKDKPEDPVLYSTEKYRELTLKVNERSGVEFTDEDKNWVEGCIERTNQYIKDYPKEVEAMNRGYLMIHNNYSERAIVTTVNAILQGDENSLLTLKNIEPSDTLNEVLKEIQN